MRLPRLLSVLLLCPLPVLANDGWGGLDATGLQFGQTEAVEMAEEELYISPTEIRVDYLFRNRTDQDVTGEVIFPLPPIALAETLYSAWNLPEDPGRDDLVNFRAEVEGRPVAVQIDRIAVIAPEWREDIPGSEQYAAPGRDVTALLAAQGLPLTADVAAVARVLLAKSLPERQQLEALGLAGYVPAGETYPEEAIPLWSVVLRYHWTQTFPAGATLRISHRYENRPPGGLFIWSHPPEDYHLDLVAQYCIDEGTSRAIARRLSYTDDNGAPQVMGSAYEMRYVLRTANSWAGPIGKFRLILDKGAAENIISLCAEGIDKTGPTTFVMEKTDFVPRDDLRILVVVPTKF